MRTIVPAAERAAIALQRGHGRPPAMPGPRDPSALELAGIEEGALAGLLLVDGNPLEDISILTEPEEILALITKDGKNHRSTIEW